ncbi:autotransporter outer membrane beta-barrel domain-containing protein [Cognatilysobacter tabacisoli]|uniref:autotransporter outer membrane beta-barrel domain-containing protein n=1 Tax=Cognatilysobacter tabacisoli TaxID=2315424 RepID=UPI00130035E4|nr:autotransporter outer membrane beta-barrel domain-containing protein [Lysobacter tabacisoli]
MADCVVPVRYTPTWDEFRMTGGRQSDFRLVVAGDGGWLNLFGGEYRFSGGTQIAGAGLVVHDTLVSNVHVQYDPTGLGFGPSELWLAGTVRGNVLNEDRVTLHHTCGTGITFCVQPQRSRIEGNYIQAPTGTLEAVLGWELQVTGTAALDGQLILMGARSQGYVLPTAPSSVLVLRADGGISGAFDGWRSSGLFLDGTLRYTAQDVYFDATRISLAAAMASAQASPAARASAARLDAAFAHADRFAGSPADRLAPSQRHFLASAASLQHIRDRHQAERSLSSLSGQGQALLGDALRRQAIHAAGQLDARLAAVPADARTHAWAEPTALRAATAGGASLDGTTAGSAHWLDRRWLVGAHVAAGDATVGFDAMGGRAHGRAVAGGVFAHRRDGGRHLTVQAGHGRAALTTSRTIDLGDAGVHVATARRPLSHAYVRAEAGRRVPFGAGAWTPYVAVDYSAVRAGRFVEDGATGLELATGDGHTREFALSAGARFAREWPVGAALVGVSVDARYRMRLDADGAAARAAFTGTPDATFALDAGPASPGAGYVAAGLTGRFPSGWQWAMDYRDGGATGAPDAGWSLFVRRRF